MRTPAVVSDPSVRGPGFGAPGPATVDVIQPAEFADTVKQGKVVVEFFSYGCSYCQRATGKVKQSAAQLQGDGVRVVALSIQDPTGMAIGRRYGLGKFPTFAVFQDGAHKGSFERNGEVSAQFVTSNARSLLG